MACAPAGTVLVVAAEWTMWQLLGVNWVAHVRDAGITNWLVGGGGAGGVVGCWVGCLA